MKILLDECLPAALAQSLATLGYECETVRQAGLGAKKNGELLSLADGNWDVLMTSDRNIRYQQNWTGRKLSVLIMRAKSNRIADLLPLIPECARALLVIGQGQIAEVGQIE